MPSPGTYIITDTQGNEPPMGLVIVKVPWYKVWEGITGGDLVYRIARPCRKYDKHKRPYIHWEWSEGCGMISPISGGAGEKLVGPGGGTILTDPASGNMSYVQPGGSVAWGPLTPGNSVDVDDPTIKDC